MSKISRSRPETALTMATAVRRSVARLNRRLRAERENHGVSGSKLSVLGHLRRAGTLTATELADRERVQPQSLTRLIAELEESGFIERTEDESDRRQVLIQITSNGQGILARDARRQDAWLAGVMTARLTGAERDILRAASKLLDRLADEAAAPTGSGEPTG